MIRLLAQLWPFRRATRRAAGADWRLKNAVRMVGHLARENERLRTTIARLEQRAAPDLSANLARPDGAMLAAAEELDLIVQQHRMRDLH